MREQFIAMDWIKDKGPKFPKGYQLLKKTIEEGQRVEQPKCCEHNNQDDDNNLDHINNVNENKFH